MSEPRSDYQPPKYDLLTTLRDVHDILAEYPYTKRHLRKQRTAAILRMAGTLGFHEARARIEAADPGSSKAVE